MKDAGVIEISMRKLLQVCSEIYQAGQSGVGDCADSAIEEALVRNGLSLADNWKIFTVKELAEMPVDTIFVHSVYGRCWISERPDEKVKFMSFLRRGPSDFRSNSDPWDKPMKIIS